MIWIILIIMVICFIIGALVGSADLDIFSGVFISGILVLIFLLFNILVFPDTNSLVGRNIPKFNLNENVGLPNGSIGKIDSVYYKVEGKIYLQSNLKKD